MLSGQTWAIKQRVERSACRREGFAVVWAAASGCVLCIWYGQLLTCVWQPSSLSCFVVWSPLPTWMLSVFLCVSSPHPSCVLSSEVTRTGESLPRPRAGFGSGTTRLLCRAKASGSAELASF